MNIIVQFVGVFLGLALVAIGNKLWSSIYDVWFKDEIETWMKKRKDKVKTHSQVGFDILKGKIGTESVLFKPSAAEPKEVVNNMMGWKRL